nr:hypothetical protein CFP56_41124 [Quercus suber]
MTVRIEASVTTSGTMVHSEPTSQEQSKTGISEDQNVTVPIKFRSVVALGYSGFGGDCGGVRGGCVGFSLGFEKEHSIGLGLGFEEECGYVGLGLGFK